MQNTSLQFMTMKVKCAEARVKRYTWHIKNDNNIICIHPETKAILTEADFI